MKIKIYTVTNTNNKLQMHRINKLYQLDLINIYPKEGQTDRLP